jgi:hypothetical protein
MKRLLFLLALPIMFSFAMPPVIQDDVKNNWVYELVKPDVKKVRMDEATVISAEWVQVNSVIHVFIECPPANYDRAISVKAYYYHSAFPGTPKWRTFTATNAFVGANVSSFTVVVYVTGVPNGGYCSGAQVTAFG